MLYIFILQFFLSSFICAMQPASSISQELKTRKLYAADFEALGIEYLARVRTFIDKTKIIPPKPYPNNKWKSYLEAQHEDWEKEISAQTHAPVYLKYINSKVGFGVFANAPLDAFDTVGEYTGYLCVEQEDDEEHDDTYSIDLGPYYGENKAPLFIDAKNAGNYTRFMNHSRVPNVNSLNVYSKDDGLWHIVMHTNQYICQDSQLLDNYGTEYWNTRNIEPVDLTTNS